MCSQSHCDVLLTITYHFITRGTLQQSVIPKFLFIPKEKNYKNCHINAVSGVNSSVMFLTKMGLCWNERPPNTKKCVSLCWLLQSNFTSSFLHERYGGSFFISSLSNNSSIRSAYILPPTVLLWSDSSGSRLCKHNLTVCDQKKISDHWLNYLCGSIKGMCWFTHTPAIQWGRSPSAFTSRWHK